MLPVCVDSAPSTSSLQSGFESRTAPHLTGAVRFVRARRQFCIRARGQEERSAAGTTMHFPALVPEVGTVIAAHKRLALALAAATGRAGFDPFQLAARPLLSRYLFRRHLHGPWRNRSESVTGFLRSNSRSNRDTGQHDRFRKTAPRPASALLSQAAHAVRHRPAIFGSFQPMRPGHRQA